MLESIRVADRVSGGEGRAVLLCGVGSLLCALPLEQVSETMRPLPVTRLSSPVPFLSGLSVVRGLPVPVVALGQLLGLGTNEFGTRLVLVKLAERRVALAVDQVIGVRWLASAAVSELPPLFRGASAEAIRAVGALDAQLLLLLETSKIVPDFTWASLATSGT
jgi:purine-binding chemotaxis protein CheW